ncbi:uncharacterized protein LOC128890300 [Hylaeus anthracinus]|uniref:uncharacterized protein LOC128890300 n=1 Tax=Hylaeus anthracinus TaxID=313031 RepID=UPI0023BA22CB|nr:uncharacterized protein LOC128890300 [Hylaeus anthracinus]
MSTFVMLNLHGLTLFIWIVSVLTLSTSGKVKTDGITSLKSASNTSIVGESSENNYGNLSSANQPASESTYSTKSLNENVTPSFVGEGGPISIASTTQRASSTTSHSISISEHLNAESNFPNEKTPKNSKIVARKGANEMNVKREPVSHDTKSEAEHSTVASVIGINEKRVNVDLNNAKSETIDKLSKDDSHTTVKNASQEKVPTSTTIITSLLKEHKAKPTVTVAGPNSDKRPFVSPTRSRLGMPKKIDYLLPVIITLLALPILGAVIFMVYKQGRDCWDKRHYRRMDFLIDGMYND